MHLYFDTEGGAYENIKEWKIIQASDAPIMTEDPRTLPAVARAREADAVLFGSVGGPRWDSLPFEQRPELGVLRLRKDLGLFANLRPGSCHPSLTHASPVKNELNPDGFDVLCVRELTGGIYFGQPKSVTELPDGDIEAIDTMVYRKSEIARITRIAFTAAMGRDKRLLSVDKANVLQNSVLWRETVIEVAKDFPEVELEHMYVDNAAMQLVKRPASFDVLVTGNLFGDILSDLCAGLTGGLGLAPGANVGEHKGIFEAVHGSAPDIAGQNIANPTALMLGAAMMLEYLERNEDAERMRKAIRFVVGEGKVTTPDLGGKASTTAKTIMDAALYKESLL